MIMKKHAARRHSDDSTSGGSSDDALRTEVEQLGAELGKRASD